MKAVWITWEEQRRNKPIAEEIGAQFYELSEIRKHSTIVRYIVGLWKTFNIFRKERPTSVIVQNPSFVLAVGAILMRAFFGYKLGIDTHNGGFGANTKSKLLISILRWIQRNADFIIAHNDGIKDEMKQYGGRFVVLPDKIPVIKRPETPMYLEPGVNFMFICSFSPDEPWRQVIQAFKHLPEDYNLYVTGNYEKVNINPNDYPANIHFLGRIPWDDFDGMLYSADVIIDLTTRENCLLCGAYEAVACGTPLVLSDTHTLKDYFYKGASYAGNTTGDIIFAIQNMIFNHDAKTKEIQELNPELQAIWQNSVSILKSELV